MFVPLIIAVLSFLAIAYEARFRAMGANAWIQDHEAAQNSTAVLVPGYSVTKGY
jgi:hypothetical protein